MPVAYLTEQDTPGVRQQRDDYRCWLEHVDHAHLVRRAIEAVGARVVFLLRKAVNAGTG